MHLAKSCINKIETNRMFTESANSGAIFAPASDGFEMGSFFEATDPRELPKATEQLNASSRLFYTGRQALKVAIDCSMQTGRKGRVFFPDYYCLDVIQWLEYFFPGTCTYPVDAFSFQNDAPPINLSRFATSNDIVVVNNFWGLSDFSTSYVRGIAGPAVIEDHSHGWHSQSSLQSNADYCIASLRKTLPIPFGGILWSSKNPIPDTSASHDNVYEPVWQAMNEAMNLKSQYLANLGVIGQFADQSAVGHYFPLKEQFLSIYRAADAKLSRLREIDQVASEHRIVIEGFLDRDFNKSKRENTAYCFERLSDNEFFRVLRNSPHVPFGLCLVMKDEQALKSLRSYLIENDIYAIHLWPGNQSDRSWACLLSLHVDFRYSARHLNRMLDAILHWQASENRGQQ